MRTYYTDVATTPHALSHIQKGYPGSFGLWVLQLPLTAALLPKDQHHPPLVVEDLDAVIVAVRNEDVARPVHMEVDSREATAPAHSQW